MIKRDYYMTKNVKSYQFKTHWWRSVQGFSVGWGSNFAILHWLWWSCLV